MQKIKDKLKKIRNTDNNIQTRTIILCGIALIIFGFVLGVFQKWLDGSAFNELPELFQRLDLTNFFGRPAIWIFLGTVISVYAGKPSLAALNTFLFFISMIAGYYIYCNYILGFLPRSYMLIWITVSFVSPLPAFICWYAKGKGIIPVIISAGIIGVLFSQAFLITQGFRITHLTEILTWAASLIVLRRKPKEFAIEIAASVPVAVIYQLLIPYWG